MKLGIAVASEVDCEYSPENCLRLVKTQEETGTPYMFVENCYWGKDELLSTSMARKNLFGTIVHCSGAYAHDLSSLRSLNGFGKPMPSVSGQIRPTRI